MGENEIASKMQVIVDRLMHYMEAMGDELDNLDNGSGIDLSNADYVQSKIKSDVEKLQHMIDGMRQSPRVSVDQLPLPIEVDEPLVDDIPF